MSDQDLFEAIADHFDRRGELLEDLATRKAGIVGEDAEAAIHHLFATTDYLLQADRETMHLVRTLARELAARQGVTLPHLRLVEDED